MTVDLAQLEVTYREHVAHLGSEYAYVLAQEKWDGVLLHSGSLKLRSLFDDQYWPLRVTPHFHHWTPLAVPDCAVLVVAGARPVLHHNVALDFWEGRTAPETDHFWSSFDVVELSDPARLKDLLPAGKRLAFVGEDRERAAGWGFDAAQVNPEQLVRRLDRLRTRKSRYELLCLAEANRRAAAGHAAVRDAFLKEDRSELDLHLLYLQATGQDDPETPYKNIVALGAHAATLHHIHYGRRPEGAQSLLLDAGATYQGYASDVTRTMAKGRGAAVDLFAELVRRLDGLQREACRRVAVGLPYERLHDLSHELLAPILRDLGVARAPDDELVASGVTRAFFPHGLGHSLGLQTHDVGCAQVRPRPDNPFLRNTSEVAPGQTFTIEPGCYFIESLLEELRGKTAGNVVDWKVVDLLRPFGGVRVEDDLAVRDASVENLTRAALGD
jgi:Xaa-Pro dipeptidase